MVWESPEPADQRVRVQVDGGAGELGIPRLVRRGEEAEIVAAFAQAERNVRALWEALCRLGLGGEVLGIAASVTEDNEPVTRLHLTQTGAHQLERLLHAGPAPPIQKAG